MTLWGPAHGLGSAGAFPAHWLGRRLLEEQPQPEESLEYFWPETVDSLELVPRIVGAEVGDIAEPETLVLTPSIESTLQGSTDFSPGLIWGVGLWGVNTWGEVQRFLYLGGPPKVRQSLEVRPSIVESGPAVSTLVEVVIPEEVILYREDSDGTFDVYVDYIFTVKLLYQGGTGGHWEQRDEDPDLPLKSYYTEPSPPFATLACFEFEPTAFNNGNTYTLIFWLLGPTGAHWDTATYYVHVVTSSAGPIPETAGPYQPSTVQLTPRIADSQDDSPRPSVEESSELVPWISSSEDAEDKPDASTVVLTPKIKDND